MVHDLPGDKSVILGARIRAMREELGMASDALARVISAPPKYVRALEDGAYDAFGAKVYAHGVLKKMLAIMAPADSQDFLHSFDEAWDFYGKENAHGRSSAPRRQKKIYFTPATAGIGAVAAVVAVFVFFAASRLIRFNGPPALIVDEPQNGIALKDGAATLKGRTERESKLTVNGREITINEQGGFAERIELQPGATELIFLSENRFGKSRAITRHVFVD